MPISTVTLMFLCSFCTGESYYAMVFAWQDTPSHVRPNPRKSHSFASWACVEDGKVVEEFTISWIAVDGVRLFHGPQKGHNMTFRESLARARSQQFCVWRWGPFVVTPEGYRAAKQAYLCLEEGERFQTIRYQALDRASRYRHPTAINCIHVLTDIARPGVRTGTLRGISASQVVVNEFRRAGMFGDIDRSVAWIWENDGIIP